MQHITGLNCVKAKSLLSGVVRVDLWGSEGSVGAICCQLSGRERMLLEKVHG